MINRTNQQSAISVRKKKSKPYLVFPNCEWTNFQPTQIATFCKRPSPIFSESSGPKTAWKTPIPKTTRLLVNKGTEEMNNESDTSVDQEFPFDAGWALKENMKLGNKGAGKRMSKKVLQYLQGFFLAGNLKAADRYSSEDMHVALKDLAISGELTIEEIPTAKTIKGWIGRYSANFKKEASEKALTKDKSNNNDLTVIHNNNDGNKWQKYG
ncbi:hypothetical protein C2G38_2183504 [Gigaspora rosea]|uniref:Uncharacterized protein n=1 Tax=Gigaspora rosea TaxID=44941 RepID=A0A397VAY5_9GLOM|nr:hypothetical protein C2G38_2183504 [Gigaspora rosea]